jgi:hypothetical protein
MAGVHDHRADLETSEHSFDSQLSIDYQAAREAPEAMFARGQPESALPLTAYAKKQLSSSKRWIRLIEFRATGEARFDFRFLVYPIQDHLPYIALSYTWGPEWPKRPVFVDGAAVAVRQNLWAALHMIQRNIRHIQKAANLESSNCTYLSSLSNASIYLTRSQVGLRSSCSGSMPCVSIRTALQRKSTKFR